MEKYSYLVYFLFLSSTISLSLGKIKCLSREIEKDMEYRCTSNGSLPVAELNMDVSPHAVKL